jgi:hypothetical protein
MAKPNNGLITETNAQYYAGSQTFVANGVIIQQRLTLI